MNISGLSQQYSSANLEEKLNKLELISALRENADLSKPEASTVVGLFVDIDFQKIHFERQQGGNRPFSAIPDR
jgi:hypothetical protein